ncbi:putative F-box protein At1g71320 [Lycium ferocissimum]|uniref:putative F-box protein At1g71320 n=1 Tax=Lycium ferocissimum TaxID=112874 RepID=UPI002815F399|nr:putative F-box protein At1g71320 [Lycium ferocissimum]
MPKKKLHKRTTFEDGTSILPSDILFNILITLPVQSLLRFESVSKPWDVMISENEFKKTHCDQSKALGREKLLFRKGSDVFEFRDLESSQLIMMENQVLFPLKKFQPAEVLCSCDGLVLLKNHKTYKNYVLWNPSTRDQYRTLSCPDNDLYYNGKPRKAHACGLCYDSSVNDFKFILIYDLFYTLYSLNKDSWTKKTSFPCPLLPPA